MGETLCRAIATSQQESQAREIIDCCQQQSIEILVPGDARYPTLLQEIHDPPGVLFCRGQLAPTDSLCIALVGMRRPSQYGLRTARRLAEDLSRAGFTIVSGLARGIDQAAHEGALGMAGRTLAVLGSGVLNIYPAEHQELATRITRQGAVLSEFPPHRAPCRGAFPQRNRLISGLSLAVIVVEAATRSGALISARHATEQGREVLAVPGRIDSPQARGCHLLLKDGAALVESATDVLQALGPLAHPATSPRGHTVLHPRELKLNCQEREVLELIEDQATSIDMIVQRSGLPTARVLATISALEMHRLLERLSGQYVVRRRP
jgi:DNA processing protein